MSKTSSRVKNRYNRKAYDRLAIMVPKGEKEKIKERAEAEGLSLNGYVKAAIEEKMAREDLRNMTVLGMGRGVINHEEDQHRDNKHRLWRDAATGVPCT